MSLVNFKTPLDSIENKNLRDRYSKCLSKRLKTIRRSKNLTQQELAERAGLHLTYIGHLELGKYHPSTFTIWKIAKALEISVGELVDC